MFKIYFMPRCPFGVDGLFCDEAMAPALCVLVDLVHPALIDPVLLIVVVRYDAVIGPTENTTYSTGKDYMRYCIKCMQCMDQ